jgi:thiamine-phosphate pyrophosphorylase
MIVDLIQYISVQNDFYSHCSGIEAACKAGITWVQLRLKDTSENDLLEQALQAKSICNDYNCTLIINDNPLLAQKINAHGVHLGKKDMPPLEARKILGPDKIIGGTANSFQDVLHLVLQGVNYIGLGPFRFTTTKKELSPVLGLQGYKDILLQCKQHNIQIPIFAIGGIQLPDIQPLMQTGIHGIALSGLLANATQMAPVVHQIKSLLN